MKGFTLLELLISTLIFSFVVIGIYFLFDEGQWTYLQSEKRGHIQENARLAVEQMERDFRMIGAGVPRGVSLKDGSRWTPFIFSASDAAIGFTADIDNGTEDLTLDVGTVDDRHIFIGQSAYYLSQDGNNDNTLDTLLPIVVANSFRTWEDLTAITLDSNDTALVTTVDIANPASFPADRSTVHTLERVFYRMVDQAGVAVANGVCSDPYPFCTLERQEYRTNIPTETNPDAESAGEDWITIATNVSMIDYDYSQSNGTAVDPSSDPLSNIDKINIVLVCRERANRVGQYQDATLESEILIRNSRM